jgi:hypothetical protein
LPRLGGSSGAALSVVAAVTLAAQQMPDRSFRPMIEDRAYATGTGPVVCFDEGHGNEHTLADGYWPFADLIRRDGYVVRAIATLEGQSLRDCRIVVIARPRLRVAKTAEMYRWVNAGGSLLLVADRDVLSAVSDLSSAFGIVLTDTPVSPARFRASNETLRPHAIARGRHAKESAAIVVTFAGVAMRVPATAEPVLVNSDGLVQGAAMRVGMGRAAFFGDAALFTAQIAGSDRRFVGMNARGAEHNFRFVLNVMHWLSGMIS